MLRGNATLFNMLSSVRKSMSPLLKVAMTARFSDFDLTIFPLMKHLLSAASTRGDRVLLRRAGRNSRKRALKCVDYSN